MRWEYLSDVPDTCPICNAEREPGADGIQINFKCGAEVRSFSGPYQYKLVLECQKKDEDKPREMDRVLPDIRAEYTGGVVDIKYYPDGINFDTPEWWDVDLGFCFGCPEPRIGEEIVKRINAGRKS